MWVRAAARSHHRIRLPFRRPSRKSQSRRIGSGMSPTSLQKSPIVPGGMMENDQRNARTFGVLFIVTFLTSIPAALMFGTVLDDAAGYIASGGNDNLIYLAALLEFVLIIANVGTAVVLFPIAPRQDKILALR